VINPGNVGLSLLVRIPGDAFGNSSPRYTELPPVALCLNAPFVFDHSATDPDGNELVYELCSPFLGGGTDGFFNTCTNATPTPAQCTAPPYNFIPWSAGYSAGYPIISSPAIAIDPATGLLTFTPTQIGRYVVGVCVTEYQDGVLISTSRRDFMFQVVACDQSVSSVIVPQSQFCTSLTVPFANASVGSPDFLWDFGEPGTIADVSTDANPTWTYSQPGTYTVTLITGPGLTCADTSQAVFNVYLPPTPTFTSPEPVCGATNLTLTATGGFGSGATLSWNFGPGGTPGTGQGVQVSSTFGTLGVQPVTLTVTENGCTGTFTGNVEVYPVPDAAITAQSQFCAGLTVGFSNASSGGVGYQWDFGVSGTTDDVSTAANPIYTYPAPGNYVVTLVATAGICSDTTEAAFQVFPNPVPTFAAPVAACGSGAVELTATGAFGSQANVTWNFGPGATPPTATGVTVSTVFPGSGSNTVTVTVTENGCTGTFTDDVVVYAQPDAFFTSSAPSPQPLGSTIVFVDGSSANGGSITGYAWTLDGNPVGSGATWVWSNAIPGDHTVTLTITTADGCTDTYIMDYFITPDDIVIPNVFTPNGDGQNDRFVIENVQYYKNELTIFNRWGQPVFEANNYQNQWSGSDVSDGTYYYVLLLNDSGKKFTGHVTVLR